jgi:hypothetical protein
MSDRELLELAAKAAGIEFNDKRSSTGNVALYCGPSGGWWNPLTDNGDALQLAVTLRRFPVIELWSDGRFWVFMPGDEQNAEPFDDDPYAATRRAIVRAAAEIGRTMK